YRELPLALVLVLVLSKYIEAMTMAQHGGLCMISVPFRILSLIGLDDTAQERFMGIFHVYTFKRIQECTYRPIQDNHGSLMVGLQFLVQLKIIGFIAQRVLLLQPWILAQLDLAMMVVFGKKFGRNRG